MLKAVLAILLSLSQLGGIPCFQIGGQESIELYAKKKKQRIVHTGVHESMEKRTNERMELIDSQDSSFEDRSRRIKQEEQQLKQARYRKEEEDRFMNKIRNYELTGEKVNARDSRGYTLLHYAAIKGWHEAAQYLLREGANPKAPDKNHMSPLDWAERNNDARMKALFERAVRDSEETP